MIEHLTVSDGTEIAYQVDDFIDPWVSENEKDTIVMQLGIDAYKPLVPFLARTHRVVRFDERGKGYSKVTPGGYRTSTERFVQDVLELVDHLGVRKFHHYCAGSNGMVGIALAVTHPDRLTSLIMQCATYGFEPEVTQRYLQGEKDLGQAIRKAGGLDEWKKRMPGGHQTLDPAKVDADMLRWLKGYRARDPLEAIIGRYSWVGGENLKDRVKDISVPTLLMNTAGSYQVPLSQGRFMAQANPRIRVVTFDGAYGAPNIQLVIPDQIGRVVLDFLSSLPVAA